MGGRLTAVALAAALSVALVSAPLPAQPLSDTVTVLTLVGRSYRSSSGEGIGMRVGKISVATRAVRSTLGARYARMAADGGMMPLLSQVPEATCDSVAVETGSVRPWVSSTMLLLSINFSGDTATVVGARDEGDHPCWEYRGSLEYSYRLVRSGGVWGMKESWVSTHY